MPCLHPPCRFRYRDHFWRRRPSFRCSLLIQFLIHTYSFLSAITLFIHFTSLYHFKRNGGRICAGRRPQHTAPPRPGTLRSHHLFLLHISLIDPLLTELSPKMMDWLRAVLGCALLAFGCSARTSILRAQRLDCLGWHLCTHSYDSDTPPLYTRVSHHVYPARAPHLFTHICTSFSPFLRSLFCTCHRSRLCTQVIMSIPVHFQ